LCQKFNTYTLDAFDTSVTQMSHSHSSRASSEALGAELSPDLSFLQAFNGDGDPVEAYFECISQCSLDDGECVTVCTTILRES
jgi:hypothetical protein